MFDWIDGFLVAMDDTVNGLYDGINQIINDTDVLLENLNTYIQFSTYYIYYSGTLITVMLLIVIAILARLKNVDSELAEIKALIKGESIPLSDEVSKRMRELLILSESNNKYHADNAKRELEVIRLKGGTIDGECIREFCRDVQRILVLF